MRFKTIQPDNPILRAEINYQRRTIPRWLQWFDRVGVIVLVLIIGLILLVTPINNDQYGASYWLYFELLRLLPPLLWITQLLVTFRFLLAGVHTMHRHRGWQQDDIIALTVISRRQMMIGKFWGALYQLRGWIVALGIINLAVFSLMSTYSTVYSYRHPLEWLKAQIPDAVIRNAPTFVLGDYLQNISIDEPIPTKADEIGLLVTYITVLSIASVLGSTAIGLLGGFIRNQTLGLTIAFLCRFAPVVIFTLYPDYPNAGGNIIWRWYEYTWFSLADSGSTGVLRSYYISRALPAFGAAIVMFLAYILFAFLVSHYLLGRQGILSASSK